MRRLSIIVILLLVMVAPTVAQIKRWSPGNKGGYWIVCNGAKMAKGKMIWVPGWMECRATVSGNECRRISKRRAAYLLRKWSNVKEITCKS